MDRIKLIVNPSSGQEEAVDALTRIHARLRARFEQVDIALTAEEGDHEREGARAAADGYTHVIAVGGDGTLNGVLNGVARHPSGLASITLGVIPAGTGNDFARTLGLPADPEAVAERIANGATRAVDVGVLNDRFFVNTSAGGLIAETSIRVDSGMKTLAGRFAYLLGGAQALLEYEPVRMRLGAAGGTPIDVDMHAFVVSNAPYIGGGYHVAPDAVIDDGLLDACVIRASSMVSFVGIARRFAQGERLTEDEAVYLRAASFEIDCGRPVWVNTDGEPLEATRLTYRVLPAGARFLC
jgi:diacylglycerol kinase (ATP)